MRAIRLLLLLALGHYVVWLFATMVAIGTSYGFTSGWEPRSFIGHVSVAIATALTYPTALMHQFSPERFPEAWDSTGLVLINSLIWGSVLTMIIGLVRGAREHARAERAA